MLLLTESARRRLTGLGATAKTPAPTTPASPTTPVTPGTPAPAGATPQPTSAAQIAAFVASACGSSPNYCTWKSGANKDGYLQAFLTEAGTTRLVPFPATSNNALMVMEEDARTNCSGQSNAATDTGASIASGVGGGLKIAATVDPEPISKGILAIVSSVVSLIGGIFGQAHAKAVAGEQADICSAVPALNAALQQIDAGLAAGSITPSQATSAYSQMQSSFKSALSANTTYKLGDALWAFYTAFTVVVQVRNQDLQNGVLTSGAPGPWTAAGQGASAALSSLASSLGISSDLMPWLIVGGAAALAFLL